MVLLVVLVVLHHAHALPRSSNALILPLAALCCSAGLSLSVGRASVPLNLSGRPSCIPAVAIPLHRLNRRRLNRRRLPPLASSFPSRHRVVVSVPSLPSLRRNPLPCRGCRRRRRRLLLDDASRVVRESSSPSAVSTARRVAVSLDGLDDPLPPPLVLRRAAALREEEEEEKHSFFRPPRAQSSFVSLF